MKDVIISIKGLAGYDENGESIEFVTDGRYGGSGGVITFEYMESELTGLTGVKTVFTVEEGRVVITREGAVTTQMTFQEGEKHYFVYETEYGAMSMGINTQSIYSTLDESGGRLEVRYILDMESAMISRNTFEIDIREA